MPRGPKGEKRHADVIGAAVMIGKIATGEIDDLPRMTARTPPPWRWGAWVARHGLRGCPPSGVKRSLRRPPRVAGANKNRPEESSATFAILVHLPSLLHAETYRDSQQVAPLF